MSDRSGHTITWLLLLFIGIEVTEGAASGFFIILLLLLSITGLIGYWIDRRTK